jgi:hypothetical protein
MGDIKQSSQLSTAHSTTMAWQVRLFHHLAHHKVPFLQRLWLAINKGHNTGVCNITQETHK